MKDYVNGNTVEWYDSVDNLPIRRFFSFSKYVMLDSGIGGSPEDVQKRMAHLVRFIRADKKEDAIMEINNLSQAIDFSMRGMNFHGKAAYCMIKSINGKSYPDNLSDDDMDDIEDSLSKARFGFGLLMERYTELKKKLNLNLTSFLERKIEEKRLSMRSRKRS